MKGTNLLIIAMVVAGVATTYGAPAAGAAESAMLAQAHKLMCADDYDSAGELAYSILSKQPANADARQYLGICAYHKGNTTLALKQFNWRVAANVATAVDYLYIGHCCYFFGDLNGAVRAYSHALEMNPRLPDAYTGLTKSYVALGSLSHANAVKVRALQYGVPVDVSTSAAPPIKHIGS